MVDRNKRAGYYYNKILKVIMKKETNSDKLNVFLKKTVRVLIALLLLITVSIVFCNLLFIMNYLFEG